MNRPEPDDSPHPSPARGPLSPSEWAAGRRHGSTPFRLLHLINDLSVGGAEVMLCRLLAETDRERFSPAVLTLKEQGPLRARVEALDIPVYSVAVRNAASAPSAAWRLVRVVRRFDPDLIQGWMYHGSLAAQLAAACAPRRVPTIWSIRQSLNSMGREKPATALAIRLCALLSRRPAQILYNSRASSAQHEAHGYLPEKTLVIPNGFDTETFRPSAPARARFRAELGLAPETCLIGLVGRYHPVKDHQNFLKAAAQVRAARPAACFLLAGKGIEATNTALAGAIERLGLKKNVHLLGERHDMPGLFAALDLAVSSSYEEGFPNVIGEAMSCGVPCVATDVSDLHRIIGETGLIVPPRDAASLAAAIVRMIDLGPRGREAYGRAARQRVIELFQIRYVETLYESLYESLVAARSRERATDPAELIRGERGEHTSC